jgi:hypothetical protein
MFVSSEPGSPAAAGAGRVRGAVRRGAALRAGARRGAARRALRLADRFAVFFFDVFLIEPLRDFAAVFADLRRFLAMRAPPVEMGARILSDKLLARVLIIRVVLTFLIVVVPTVHPSYADQAPTPAVRLSGQPGGAAAGEADVRMPFEKGTIEISVLGGTTLPIELFRAKSDRQLSMASLVIGRVMAGGPGKGSFEMLVDVTPFFQVRQPDLVRGWSAAPLFLRWNFPAIGDGIARVYAEVSGSVLFTTAPVPVRTTTFNFMDQAGFGIRFEENRRRAWLVGYRFQHISNAGRVKPNPGANFNFVYLGVSFLRP